MLKSVNIVMPVRVETESGEFHVFFVDFFNASVFDTTGKATTPEMTQSVIEIMTEQQKTFKPNIPYEKIHEVLQTEKNLAKENNKHVFRRSN